MKKRAFAILVTLSLIFSLAACASGESGESSQPQELSSAESSETQQEGSEPPQSSEASEAEEGSTPAEDAESVAADSNEDEKPIKNGHDDLTEEDIQALKDAIGKAVIAEYCEPNDIDPADFSWDVFTSSGGSGYFMWMDDLYDTIHDTGEYTVQVDDERIKRVTVEDGADETDKVTAAVCNGVLDFLNTQAPYNVGYYHSMSRIPGICDLVETIDLTALSE